MIDIRRKVAVFGHNAGYGKRIMSGRFTEEGQFEGTVAKK